MACSGCASQPEGKVSEGADVVAGSALSSEIDFDEVPSVVVEREVGINCS